MQRGKCDVRKRQCLAVAALALSASLSVGCVTHVTDEFLTATTTPDNQAKLDKLRDRTAVSLKLWTDAAVSGAMQGWSDPQRQTAFREQTGKLAHDLAEDAVQGLVDGATDPERTAKLQDQLKETLEKGLAGFSQQLSHSISPALDHTLDSASKTLAQDLRKELGPALGGAIRDEVMPGLADGLRKDLGPALAEVISRDIAGPLQKDIGPSLGSVVGKAVEDPFNRIIARLERLSDKTKEDAVGVSRNVAIALVLALVACLVGAAFARRKLQAQVSTVELLTTKIKKLEADPGVQRLLNELHEASLGTEAGDYLHSFLDARPTLRARRARDSFDAEPATEPA